MSLAFPDVQGTGPDTAEPIVVLAPRHYQDPATAAFEDAELLLSSILPDARIEHVGASAVPGAYSRGGVDVCVAVPPDSFHEALGVLCEAGYLQGPEAHAEPSGGDRRAALLAPHAPVALTLQLIESGSRHESLMRFRDALRGDAALLARYNAIRIEAGPLGGAAYRDAKARFIATALGAA